MCGDVGMGLRRDQYLEIARTLFGGEATQVCQMGCRRQLKWAL
jgi:hypothetical protein